MERFICITNNPMVAAKKMSNVKLHFFPFDNYFEILKKVRGEVHEGYELATHPLTSSLKPNETPYRTVLLFEKQGDLHVNSLELIEAAISLTEKFHKDEPTKMWSDKILQDFQLIDYEMVKQWLT